MVNIRRITFIIEIISRERFKFWGNTKTDIKFMNSYLRVEPIFIGSVLTCIIQGFFCTMKHYTSRSKLLFLWGTQLNQGSRCNIKKQLCGQCHQLTA